MSSYAEEYKNLVAKGIVDEAYPVDGLCVELPNGWFGIHAIIDKYARLLKEYGYEEEMIPSVSTGGIYNDVPENLQGNVKETVLKITHTGLKKLEEPYFMCARPDLVLPAIDMINARSYRNLPIRRISDGFRYLTYDDCKDKYALITDIEQPAKDIIGIVFNLEEYEAEVKRNLEILHKILEEDCKLNTFSTRRHHSISVFAIFPNGQVCEVCTVRLYYQALSEALKLTVLGPDNKQTPPYIFDIHVGSPAFAATIVAHSTKDKVVLPKELNRCHGVAYQMEVHYDKVRVDNVNKPFTQERFALALEQGALFALVKDEKGVKIITPAGEEVVAEDAVEAKLAEIVDKREVEIKEEGDKKYNELYNANIQVVDKEEAPEGKVVLGLVMKDQTCIDIPFKDDEAKKYIVASPLIPIHH